MRQDSSQAAGEVPALREWGVARRGYLKIPSPDGQRPEGEVVPENRESKTIGLPDQVTALWC